VHLGNLGAWCKDSQGVPPKRGDDSWLERLDLPGEERGARCSLRLLWIAVSRWPTLHRIQDEHLLTAKADRGHIEQGAKGSGYKIVVTNPQKNIVVFTLEDRGPLNTGKPNL
jgi:hypothetical protein